jgi:hypothetical protein
VIVGILVVAGRRTYFAINGIQLATSWTAFALFLLALISL